VNIAILNNQAPFVRGGAELLADALREKLVEHGHAAEVIRIPFRWHPPEVVPDHIVAARLLALGNVDHVIALKFPAYLVRHSSKKLWLLHQFRQAYDLYGTALGDIPVTPEGEAVRDAVRRADDAYLREASAIYTNSAVTSDRLRRFNGLDSTVLHPPLSDTGGYRSDGPGDYIFSPGRISGGKRQRLLVEAMAHVSTGVRLLVAGPAEDAEEAAGLHSLIEAHGLGDRVSLEIGWISDQRKKDLLAGALAVAYIPYDEDSYGFVTLESFESRKTVITCSDSGGTLQLVVDGETGHVVEPDPYALARSFDALASSPDVAQELGKAGYDRTRGLDISWDRVISSLLP
jgi:glycosyltransferase involved in cell wall biosynthesis